MINLPQQQYSPGFEHTQMDVATLISQLNGPCRYNKYVTASFYNLYLLMAPGKHYRGYK